MLKASTIYAAYGKKQPAAAQETQGTNGLNEASTSSSSLPGSLSGSSSGAGTSQQQTQQSSAAGSLTSRQTKQQHALRSQRSNTSRTTAANSTFGASITSTAGTTSSSFAGQTGSGTLGGFSAQQSSTWFSLEPRTWIQQAADVTDGLLDASKYKSLAVYAEVRLTEALDKAAQACPNSIAGAAPEDCDEGQPLPNPLATAVCCQLLGELADMCGPFQPTLLKIREALLPSIYSCCSGPSLAGNRPLQFDMLPWFALAGRLRRQNNQLLEQQAAFSQELAQHQEHMAEVEQQMQSLQAALETGTAAAAALQATNATLVAERMAAVAEAAVATEEVKKLAEDVVRLAAELDGVQEQLSSVKEEYENEQEQWKAQLDVYLQKLNVEAHERMAAVALAAMQHQEVEQKLWEAERRLEEAEQQLQQQRTARQDQQQLTPRPSDWGPAQQLADSCKSTAETVRQLQQQHASQLKDLQRQLQLLTAMAQPDPQPRPWQLNLRAEASKYFLTELEIDSDPANPANSAGQGLGDQPPAAAGFSAGRPKPKLFAAGLGLGPEVPRYLRWDQPVEVHDVSLQVLEHQVSELWQAKAAYKAAHGPCCLQTFLYEHYKAQAASAGLAAVAAPAAAPSPPAAAAAAAAVAAEDTAVGPKAVDSVAGAAKQQVSCDGGSTASQTGAVDTQASVSVAGCLNQPSTLLTAAAAAAATAGYQLYYACCTHRHDSAAVELLWLVLTGQLPEAVLAEQRHQLQELTQTLHNRASAAAAIAAAAAAAVGVASQPESAAGEAAGGSSCGSGTSSSSSGGAGRADVPWSEVASTVQALFPAKPAQQQQELTSWLAAACGLPGASSSGSSSSSGANRPEARVPAATLAAVASTLQQQLRQRFGSSALPAPATPADDLAQVAQQVGALATVAGVNAAAVRQLADGVLRQHLQGMLQHSQQVLQGVKQQLQVAGSAVAMAGVPDAAAAAAASISVLPAEENPVWPQLAQYLQAQGLQAGTSASSSAAGAAASGAACVDWALATLHAARTAAIVRQTGADAGSVLGMLQRSCLFMPPDCRVGPAEIMLLPQQSDK